jgi:hypothetical protein
LQDDNIGGQQLSWYDYGARNYDPALGRWMNVDLLMEKYRNVSPYVYVADNPINAIDPDWKEIIFLIRDPNNSKVVTNSLTYRNGNFWHENGKRYNPGKESLSPTLYKVLASYRKLESSGDKTLIRKLKTLETSKQKHYVEHGSKNEVGRYVPSVPFESDIDKMIAKGTPVGTSTTYNFSKENKEEFEDSEGVPNSNMNTVAHEIQHQFDYDQGNMADSQGIDSSSKDPAEIRAVFFKNLARQVERQLKRERYGDKIDPEKLKNPPNNN